MADAVSPQRTLEPCPQCRDTVCVRRWVMAHGTEPGSWQELDTPQSPVCGVPHQCETEVWLN